MEPQELAKKCGEWIKNVDGTAPNEHRYTQAENAPKWSSGKLGNSPLSG